ncbi:hypothetical protein [Rhizobium leguminosarum]|uniref:hypothetical protein n=1 Tax=Rhizobium leguminosarum TaxID=384 RepID=UPI002E127AEE|nr:hypothetical protein U8Q02_39705 [Rhizobium leguminosarum]
MSKKSKGLHAKPFSDGATLNFVPGWIGGRLTSPLAQKEAKDRMKEMMRDRVTTFGELRDLSRVHKQDVAYEEPVATFGR